MTRCDNTHHLYAHASLFDARMKSRPLLERLDEMRALAVDVASFGFVNLLQARHPLPPDFRQTWDQFNAEWANRPVEDFYKVPEDFVPPELPDYIANNWSDIYERISSESDT